MIKRIICAVLTAAMFSALVPANAFAVSDAASWPPHAAPPVTVEEIDTLSQAYKELADIAKQQEKDFKAEVEANMAAGDTQEEAELKAAEKITIQAVGAWFKEAGHTIGHGLLWPARALVDSDNGMYIWGGVLATGAILFLIGDVAGVALVGLLGVGIYALSTLFGLFACVGTLFISGSSSYNTLNNHLANPTEEEAAALLAKKTDVFMKNPAAIFAYENINPVFLNEILQHDERAAQLYRDFSTVTRLSRKYHGLLPLEFMAREIEALSDEEKQAVEDKDSVVIYAVQARALTAFDAYADAVIAEAEAQERAGRQEQYEQRSVITENKYNRVIEKHGVRQ